MTVEDAARILEVTPDELRAIPVVTHGKRSYVSDKDLGRAWASGSISSPRSRFRRGSTLISFDELILLTLIEITLPDAIVESQIPVGNRIVDLRLTNAGKSVLVEFFGPYHFIRRSMRQRPLIDPLRHAGRTAQIADQECVIWPYWVQRCASNVRALFDQTVQGIGSIWSTSAHFGDFDFPHSSYIIKTINSRFRIERNDGVGYMYTDQLVSKPVHPIIRRIREGREDLGKLIPLGAYPPHQYWLPKSLWPLLPQG